MEAKGTETDLVHLLSLSATIWLAYVCALAAIDYLFYPHPVFRPLYYLINGMNALAVLGLAVWFRGRSGLGRIFLPLVIVLMAVAPIVVSNVGMRGLPHTPANRPEGIMLRLLPTMFMALVLTAWQYRWRHVVIFTLGMGGFSLGMHVLRFSPPRPFLPPVIVLVIQTVSFLLVGYFISTLMNRLRAQSVALEQANSRLVHYADTLEHLTISRERNRLARELHDTLAHTLSGLSVQLETAKAYFDVDSEATRKLLDKSLEATRSGLTETRRALKALRASPLDDLGLVLALRRMAEESAARAKLKLHLSLPDQLESLSPNVEHAIYRVAQEAVANVVHHANAQNLTLQLTPDENGLSLLVSDDGMGFHVQREETGAHFGLAGMRERAQLTGAHLSVDSRPGQGTTIQLKTRG